MSIPIVDRILLFFLVSTGLLALFGTVLTLAIIFTHQDLRRAEYMIFIINRLLFGFFSSIQYAVLQPLAIAFDSADVDHVFCKIAATVFSILTPGVIISDVLLAYNRFVAVCRRDSFEKIFGRRIATVAMCVGVWIVSVSVAVHPLTRNSGFGRREGTFCAIRATADSRVDVLLVFLFIILACAYIAWCYRRIYRTIKFHQDANNSSSTGCCLSSLQEDKSLLKYLATIGIVPFTMIPLVVTSTLAILGVARMSDGYLNLTATSLVLIYPLLNPYLTLSMVKPIRVKARSWVRRLRNWRRVDDGGEGATGSAIGRQGRRVTMIEVRECERRQFT